MLKTPEKVKSELLDIGLTKEQLRRVERIFRNYRFAMWSVISLQKENEGLIKFIELMKATE